MAPCYRATARARARARSKPLLPLSRAAATYGWKNGLHLRAHYEVQALRPHRQDVRAALDIDIAHPVRTLAELLARGEMMSTIKIWTGEV
jgi:hypothetical protein